MSHGEFEFKVAKKGEKVIFLKWTTKESKQIDVEGFCGLTLSATQI